MTGEEGGWHWALYVFGYVGAFLTAIYTFRMIFRTFHGEPCEAAVELESGHPHHAAVPFNPANGEEEDLDVGFPGPTHAIAEKQLPMKVAMSVLAVGAVGAGLVQIPNVDYVIDDFLRPSFATSPLYEPHTKNGLLWFGLILGTLLGLAGIAIAYRIWVARPGTVHRHPAPPDARVHAVREQVVFRRADRRASSCAPSQRPVASRATTFEREGHRRDDRRRHDRASSGPARLPSEPPRAASCATTPRCCVLGVTGVGFYFLLQS